MSRNIEPVWQVIDLQDAGLHLFIASLKENLDVGFLIIEILLYCKWSAPNGIIAGLLYLPFTDVLSL